MNEIKVIKPKDKGYYNILIDDKLVDAFVSIERVVSWLELNFSPPIKVRWFVGTADQNIIKEKYSY